VYIYNVTRVLMSLLQCVRNEDQSIGHLWLAVRSTTQHTNLTAVLWSLLASFPWHAGLHHTLSTKSTEDRGLVKFHTWCLAALQYLIGMHVNVSWILVQRLSVYCELAIACHRDVIKTQTNSRWEVHVYPTYAGFETKPLRDERLTMWVTRCTYFCEQCTISLHVSCDARESH